VTAAEKVALCRRSYEAFSDGPDLDALLPLYRPECEWSMESMGAAFGTEAFRGHDGVGVFVAALVAGRPVHKPPCLTSGGHTCAAAHSSSIKLASSSYPAGVG
jgi:hypothetical protein